MRGVALATVNLPTKFGVSISSHYEDLKGDAKCRKWGGLRLKLNADKTHLIIIWLGTRQQLAKLTVTQLRLTSSVVELDSTVTDLGVVFDN